MKTTPDQEQILLDAIQALRDPEEIGMARAVCADLATLRAHEQGLERDIRASSNYTETDSAMTGLEGHGSGCAICRCSGGHHQDCPNRTKHGG